MRTCCQAQNLFLTSDHTCQSRRQGQPEQAGRICKARLGRVVRRRTCSSLAITHVNPEDRANLNKLVESVKTNFNDRFEEIRRHWGGGILGAKSQARLTKLERVRAKEIAR